MAEFLTDESLQKLVETCKKKRLERTVAELSRDLDGRVFVNRSVSMDKIKYIGFDMDHTLVVYKSPEYDLLAYDMAIERLIQIGYPSSIRDIKYDDSFPIRGLFFDKVYGNLLKLDAFGNILSCFHGFTSIPTSEMRRLYPNKYVQPNHHERMFNMDTLFHIPETFILAALVDFFDQHPLYEKIKDGHGVQHGDIIVTYQMIQQDVRNAIDWIHNQGNLKQRTLDDLDHYVKRDSRLPLFLDRLRQSGRKLFIATNSGYQYTSKIMRYLLNFPEVNQPDNPRKEWKTYFDYIIVDAKKPLFFQEGTMLREVDELTGSLRLGMFTGELKQGKVFSGGSSESFCKIAGAQGKEVLYVGDHIFGDIIKSKKEQAFRTFLVIPELTSEINSWDAKKAMFLRLQNLEFLLAEMYQRVGSDPHQLNIPDIGVLRQAIKETAESIESGYSKQLGSLLRCGSRLTYFANQVSRFADIYSSACVNLVNYPIHYLFTSPHQLMAHESSPSETSTGVSDRVNSPVPILTRMKKKYGESIVDFDLDEEDINGGSHITAKVED